MLSEAADSSNERPSKKIKISGTSDQEMQDKSLLRRSPSAACFRPGTANGLPQSAMKQPVAESRFSEPSKLKLKKCKKSCFFIGDPIPSKEAEERWQWRYEIKVIN